MYEPERLESDDERLTAQWERKNASREYNDYESDDDDENDYCSTCGHQTVYSFEEGGRICYKHGLQ